MLLKNVTSLGFERAGVASTSIRIRGDEIVEKRKNLLPHTGEETYDCQGKLVLPGFVCAHTHLYSSLSRGMPAPSRKLSSFLEILKCVWWKLDRALDEEAIYYSALVGAIESVRCGTTSLVDHHASPNAIKGSLDIIRQALQEVGLRGLLCYEVTDRGGKQKRNEGLKENERFIEANDKNGQFRGVIGAHASFTLSEESLRLCGELAKELHTGVHIHLAEDRCDVQTTKARYRQDIVKRLHRHNILGKNSILAHCIHLTNRDFLSIHSSKSWLVHNPRSNMNNRVGTAPTRLFGKHSALGTDGFPADMLEEARTAFFLQRESQHQTYSPGRSERGRTPAELLHGGHQMITHFFGRSADTLDVGSLADLVVVDYFAPTPLTRHNFSDHLLFGMNSSMIESVMVGGRWVMKKRDVLGVDVTSVYDRASRVAKKLWNRIARL